MKNNQEPIEDSIKEGIKINNNLINEIIHSNISDDEKKNDSISLEIIDEKEPVLSTDNIPSNDLFEISIVENNYHVNNNDDVENVNNNDDIKNVKDDDTKNIKDDDDIKTIKDDDGNKNVNDDDDDIKNVKDEEDIKNVKDDDDDIK